MANTERQNQTIPRTSFRLAHLFSSAREDRVAVVSLWIGLVGFLLLLISFSCQNLGSYHNSTGELLVNTVTILVGAFGVFLYFMDAIVKFQVYLAKSEIHELIQQNRGRVCLNLLPATQLKSIDAFCQLLDEKSFFIDHPIVRQKGTLKFSSLMQDLDLYRQGTIPIRDLAYLKEVLLEIPKHFSGDLKIECVNSIPEHSWPATGQGERWARFVEYADFMEESLKPHGHVTITQTFVFATPDDFTKRLSVLKSIANHWWRTAVISGNGVAERGGMRIAYHAHADIRTSEPHICWRITGSTPNGPKSYCLELWPSYGNCAFLGGRDDPDHRKLPAALLLNDELCSESTRLKFALYLDGRSGVDSAKQVSIMNLNWPALRAELEQCDPEYKVLAVLRENWLRRTEEVRAADTKFLANHLEDWRFNGLYQEILELSRQVREHDGKDRPRIMSRVFYHSIRPADSVVRKRRALEIVRGHLGCGVRIGLVSVDRWPATDRALRAKKTRDFNLCGDVAFELTEFAGGEIVERPRYELAEYGTSHPEFTDLGDLWAELDALCAKSADGCMWIEPNDPTREQKLRDYFVMSNVA